MDVELPNGTVIEGVPDGMSKSDLQALAVRNGYAKESDFSTRGNIAHHVLKGGTLGWGDELVAGGTALAAKLTGKIPEGETIGDAYRDIHSSINTDTDAFARRNPKTALGAEVASGLLVPGLGGAKAVQAATKGASVRKKAAIGSTVGGVESSLYGAGSAAPGERFQGGADALVPGLVLGGGLGAGAAKLEQRADAMADQVKRINQNSGDADLARYRVEGASAERVTPDVTLTGQSDPLLPAPVSADLVTYRQVGGKRVKDKAAEEVLRHGVEPGYVQQIKTATPDDRRTMLKMIQVAKAGRKNTRVAAELRPNEKIGEVLTGRVNFLKTKKKEAGNQLDSVAAGLRGQQVDYSPAVTNFMQQLEGFGVNFNMRGGVGVDMSRSNFEGIPGLQNEVMRIMKRMGNTEVRDAHDVHRLKRYLDTRINWGKSPQGGMPGELVGAIKGLRRDLDGILDSNFPEYNRVNTQYSDFTGALDDLQDAWGGKVDITSDRALGIASRKLLSNYTSGSNQLEAIKNTEALIKQYGGKVSNNVMDLVTVDSLIRQIVPQKMMNTFQGDQSKVASQAVRTMVGSNVDGAASALDAINKKLRGSDPDKALDALEKLLKESLQRTQ